MNARELETMLVRFYGPDFRDKAITTPAGSYALRDSFAECGLEDPQAPPNDGGYGIWQTYGPDSGG